MDAPTIDERSRQEAAAWLLRLREPSIGEEDIAEWIAWCEADPRNRAAFDAMDEMWQLAGGLDRAVVSGAGAETEAAVVALPRRRRRLWLGGALAALAASLLALVAAPDLLPGIAGANRPQVIEAGAVARLETERGRVQSARLPDGSEVEIGGRSALSVRYTPQSRLVIAESGEAFFDVAKKPDQPFIVQAGPLTITAIGTAFSVQRDGSAVSVMVTEGVVEVRAHPSLKPGDSIDTADRGPVVTRVAAGQRVRFDRGELTQSVDPVTSDVVGPWREGRLDFKDEPLRLVVARVNRYSPTRIEISDPAIEDLRVTTTVYNDRVDAWLSGIEMVLPVRVTRLGEKQAIIAPALSAKGQEKAQTL